MSNHNAQITTHNLLITNHYSLITIIALFLMSCGNTVPEEEHAEQHEHVESQTEVTITKKQFEAIQVQLGTIEEKNLTDVLKVTGSLKVPPQNKASVSAFSGGTVQAILVQEGDLVQSGQTLARLVNPEFVTMQQEYLDAQSRLIFAEAEFIRQKQLSEKNITAQKNYQQAESEYNSLKSKKNALIQQLNLLGINTASLTSENISSVINVKSPIKGNISHIDVNIGSTVEPSKELMDVVDNSQLHLDLFIYEQDLTKIKVGQTVDVILTNLPGKQYTAKIFAVGSAFEGESKSIPVHAAITGDKTGLIEGMNVTANISIKSNLTAAVPSSAIINNAGNDFIFIQTEGHEHTEHEHSDSEEKMVKEELGDEFTFSKIEVRKGVSNGAYTEIMPLQAITGDPKVVVNGAFYLMSMLTNEEEEGHEH